MKKNLIQTLSWATGEIVGDYLWIATLFFEAIYKINLRTGKITYIKSFDSVINECVLSDRENVKFRKSFIYKNYIYFFVNDGSGYIKINVQTEECLFRRIENYKAVTNIISWKGQIYLIPATLQQPLMYMNLETEKINCCSDYIKDVISLDDSKTCMIMDSCLIENEIWMTIQNGTYVLVYDIIQNQFKIFNIGKEDYKLFGINSVKDTTIWFTQLGNGVLLCYDKKAKQIQEKVIFDHNIEENLFSRVIVEKEMIILFPYDKQENIFIFNLQENKIYKLKYPDGFSFIHKELKGWKLWDYRVINNLMYIFPMAGNMMLLLDIDKMELSGFIYTISSEKELERIVARMYMERKNLGETPVFDLQQYLYYLNNKERKSVMMVRESASIGKCIFKELGQMCKNN